MDLKNINNFRILYRNIGTPTPSHYCNVSNQYLAMAWRRFLSRPRPYPNCVRPPTPPPPPYTVVVVVIVIDGTHSILAWRQFLPRPRPRPNCDRPDTPRPPPYTVLVVVIVI